MAQHDGGLFVFARHAESQPETLPLIKAFAQSHAFRSATVEELQLPDESYRRPLRPEDLDFLSFKRAIRLHTVSQLPSLATQRLLFCINEMGISRLPTSADLSDHLAFHGAEARALGERIRPYLQAYGFDYAARAAATELSRADAEAFLAEQAMAHGRLIALLIERDHLRQGGGFVALQYVPLFDMQLRALATASALGVFDVLPASARPVLPAIDAGQALLDKAGHIAEPHAYWQFYLSASLGRPNLLWSFVRSPADTIGAWGAFFAAEAEMTAFLCFVGQGLQAQGGEGPMPPASTQSFADRLDAARQLVRERWGQEGASAFARGFWTAAGVYRAAMRDLTEQMTWLSDIPRYVQAAGLLEDRINREDPGIDRETFVEPREMCSTTHVHNDHRLVVIERGDMIFWGNPGMRLALHPGDRVLIPAGRLHGSTVTSEECTYHQPIIPEPWMVEALERAGQASNGNGHHAS